MDFSSLDLSLVFSPEGITIFAALLMAFVQLLKRIPQFGAWLENGNEPALVILLAFVLVVYAGLAVFEAWDLNIGFRVFTAWIGIAGLSTVAYEVTPQQLRTALGGTQ